MKPRFHTVLVGLLAAMFLAGCSIRTVPLEEEQMVHEDEYYRGYNSLPPSFLYDTWQMSQYYHYYGSAPEFGYRMNIDPNPNDSYHADEKPVQSAPAQTSIQPSTPNHRVEERQDYGASERAVSRSRHARANRLASKSTDDTRVRERLRQRHRQRTTNTAKDDDREGRRRTTRRRARR